MIPMPMLPRRRHEIGEPVEKLKRRELDDAIGSRPRGLAAGTPPDPTRAATLSWPTTCRSTRRHGSRTWWPSVRCPAANGRPTTTSHAAELEKVLDAALAERWRQLARELKLPAEKLPVADGTLTRGDWVRAAFSLSR